MKGKIGKAAAEYFRENSSVLFLLLIVFVVGIISGALTATTLNTSQKNELFNYINGFLETKAMNITHGELFRQIFFNNATLILVLWFLGATIVGIPLIIGLVGFKGFTIGFTISFMLDIFCDIRGMLMIISSIIPQALIILPCITILSISALRLSLFLLKGVNQKKCKHNDIKFRLFTHTLLSIIFLILTAFEALLEMLILPMFLNVIYTNFYSALK